MECQDFPASIESTGLMFVGTPFDSRFEVCDTLEVETTVDSDWIGVDLVYGQTYLFVLTTAIPHGGVPPTLTLADSLGNANERYDRIGDRFFQVTARYSGRHFLVANQGFTQLNTDYTLAAYLSTDDTRGAAPRFRVDGGYVKADTLETAADTDTFDLVLRGNHTWFIHARGLSTGSGTLADPVLTISRNAFPIGSDDNSGAGNDALFVYQSSGLEDVLQVTVSGSGPGSYRLIAVTADEAAGSHLTMSNLQFSAARQASKSMRITHPYDTDWHRFRMNAGEIVEVTIAGSADANFLKTPSAKIIDSAGNVLASSAVTDANANIASTTFYARAQSTGGFYAIAETASGNYIGGYDLTVRKVRTPFEANALYGRGDTARLPVTPEVTIQLADLLDTKGLQPHSYEVWSEVALMRNGMPMAADTVHRIPANEIDLWEVTGDGSEESLLYLRGYAGIAWSQWQKFPLRDISPLAALDSGATWSGSEPIRYRFVSTLPNAHDAGDYDSVSFIGAGSPLAQAVRLGFGKYNTAGLTQPFIEARLGEPADVDIFMATGFPQPILSYIPGLGKGGDIVFNGDIYGSGIGAAAEYQIVRAIGNVLGLNPISGVSHLDSVMGDQAWAGGALPIGPGVQDINALQQMYGSLVYDPTDAFPGSDVITISSTPEIVTITREAKRIAAASGFSDDLVIDLRDGARSGLMQSGAIGTEVYIAAGAMVTQATGGDGNDELYGNGLDNVLRGGNGTNFLFGYGGDDRFFGGTGSDTFIHYFGDGNDIIVDSGGTDTLCFFGVGDFAVDDLRHDYTFHKNGQYLDINLTLDGGYGEGFVRIDSGANGERLVESLELWHENTLTARISLANIWNRLGNGQQSRFQLGGGSDQFGLLSSPVSS